jgi:hypothetical protein
MYSVCAPRHTEYFKEGGRHRFFPELVLKYYTIPWTSICTRQNKFMKCNTSVNSVSALCGNYMCVFMGRKNELFYV